MRKGINFGQSRARAQFLRKISEVNLGNIRLTAVLQTELNFTRIVANFERDVSSSLTTQIH